MKEKKCSQCGQLRTIDEFFIDRRINKTRSYCKWCSIASNVRYAKTKHGKQIKKHIRKDHSQRKISLLNDIKAYNKCVICNEDCHICLDFHHIHGKKYRAVSACTSWTALFYELDKCVILCSNCHRKTHDGLISIPEGCGIYVPPDLLKKYIRQPCRIKYWPKKTTPLL